MQMQMQNAIQSMPEKQRRWTQDETDKVRIVDFLTEKDMCTSILKHAFLKECWPSFESKQPEKLSIKGDQEKATQEK